MKGGRKEKARGKENLIDYGFLQLSSWQCDCHSSAKKWGLTLLWNLGLII